MICLEIIEKTYNWSGPLTTRAATKYIVLHHRAGVGDIKSLHQLHLQTGYTGIGYHFYIRKDGTVYRGRPINTVGAHCLGSNADSIGICFEGDYTRETMPAAQFLAGLQLIRDIKELYAYTVDVKKHSDLYNTVCPGNKFPFKELVSMTINDAIHILKTVVSLEESTINFLLCYKYGEELVIKIAKAVRK